MRHICGGEPGALLIEAAHYTRQQLTRDKWCGLDTLLLQQPYVADVREYRKGEAISVNLNDFRAPLMSAGRRGALGAQPWKEKHLTHWMCDIHTVPQDVLLTQWLTVEPNKVAQVVFSRAGAGRPAHQVYQNSEFPWHRMWDAYHKDAVFIGSDEEHFAFSRICGHVPHYKTATLLDAARVIAGARVFVGNQTCTHAIAEALKVNIILEVWRAGPNCLVFRDGVRHGWNHEVEPFEL